MPTEKKSEGTKILLVRNDNIGDLICSIPSIQWIRRRFPDATIHLLVNSYNAPVVECLFPQWVDRLVIYQKTKHVGFSAGQLLHLAKFYASLRKESYEIAVLLVGGNSRQAQSFARWSGARRVIGYGPGNEGPPLRPGLHELEYSWNLASHLCGVETPPPLEIDYPLRSKGKRVAIQITSRKLGNRWNAASFVELARQIHAQTHEKSLLLWSPGTAQTRMHPGDDEKAAEILRLAPETLEPRPTANLPGLISALQECGALITPDGGAMHLGAAMGLRVVAMFAQSDPVRWRPWTPHARVLHSRTSTIRDITIDAVARAYSDLDLVVRA